MHWVFVLLLSTIWGCGDDGEMPMDTGAPADTSVTPDVGDPADTSTPLPDGGGSGTVSAEIGPITVPSGSEATMCVVRRLPLMDDAIATAVRTHVDEGSHHVIVYRLDGGTVTDEPFPCTPFNDILTRNGVPIVLAQEAERTVQYPDGTGLRLSAGQLVRIELHYINATPGPLDVGASVDFDVTTETADLQEIGYIFSGPIAIDVAPRSTGTVSRTYSPPGGIRLFGVTTHTHQWATLSTVTLTNEASPSGTEIHRSTTWSEPPLDTFDPATELMTGDTLEVRCEYENGSDVRVGFGESANDEMCFMIALYYPSRGFILDI